MRFDVQKQLDSGVGIVANYSTTLYITISILRHWSLTALRSQ